MDMLSSKKEDRFFWVDAGASRFLSDDQHAIHFPDLVTPGKLSIQTIYDDPQTFPSNSSEFAKCIGCGLNLFKGTIFGGDRDTVLWTSEKMLNILHNDMLTAGIMDNEQAGFALLYSLFPHKFRILFPEKDFGRNKCNFVCI